MQNIKEEMYKIAKEFSLNATKPYIAILQPRRDLEEAPAQNLSEWSNRHINTTSFAISYHAVGGYPVDVARNMLIDKAIKDDPKYILFVDEDTVLPWDAVVNLLETSAKYPNTIVNGVYYVKFGNVMISIFDECSRLMVPDVTPNTGVIRDVENIGLGCTLIPMGIIHKLKTTFKDIPLSCVVPSGMWGDPDIKFMGEDTWFYNLCRKINIEVIADTRVHCLHMELKTGKYEAHPDVDLGTFKTNIPIAGKLGLQDQERVSEDYMSRICESNFTEGEEPIGELLEN